MTSRGGLGAESRGSGAIATVEPP